MIVRSLFVGIFLTLVSVISSGAATAQSWQHVKDTTNKGYHYALYLDHTAVRYHAERDVWLLSVVVPDDETLKKPTLSFLNVKGKNKWIELDPAEIDMFANPEADNTVMELELDDTLLEYIQAGQAMLFGPSDKAYRTELKGSRKAITKTINAVRLDKALADMPPPSIF